jgi:hypothetical protein
MDLRARPGEQLHLAPGRQFTDTTQVVVVLMGVRRVADTYPLGSSLAKIGLDIAPHIKHEGFPSLFRSHQVRSLAQALKVKLLEIHRRNSCPIAPWAAAISEAWMPCRLKVSIHVRTRPRNDPVGDVGPLRASLLRRNLEPPVTIFNERGADAHLG